MDTISVPKNEFDAVLQAARGVTTSSVASAGQVDNLRRALRALDQAQAAPADATAGSRPALDSVSSESDDERQ